MKKTYEVKLAEVLAEEMYRGRWTVAKLSEESGVPQSTLREWLNGRVPKNPVQVRCVVEELKVGLHYFYFKEQSSFQERTSTT